MHFENGRLVQATIAVNAMVNPSFFADVVLIVGTF